MKLLKTLLFSVALLGMQTAYSQAQVGIGIKGGLNFATLDVNQSIGANYSNRTGYHFGAFTLFKFGKIGIQPELLFSKQGTQVTVSAQNIDQNFDYLNIPVIFKLYTIGGINLQIGPQIGFLTSAQAKSTVSGSSSTANIQDFYNSNDFSLALGLGWDLPFGLSFDARYNHGLTEINKSNVNGTKNQVFQISAGYRLFKFGH